MTLSELSSLRFATCRAVFRTYPRQVLYEFIRKNAALSSRPYSDETMRSIQKLTGKVHPSRGNALRDLVSHDLNETIDELKSIDPTYSPEKSLPPMRDDVIAFLEGELECKAPVRLNLSVVEKYPHPYERVSAHAWSLSQYESKIIGIPMGVYMKRDGLIPIFAEWVVAHEFAHSVIVDLPNYVTWFDEGLADFLGYVYYVRRVGKTADLSISVNYRTEFESYGKWYAEYDKLISNLLVCCGINFIKTLVKLKQTDPDKVDWAGLVRTLQTDPTYESLRKHVNAPVAEDRSLPPDYASVAALMTTPTLAYSISPEAYTVLNNILSDGRKTKSRRAFKGVPSSRWKIVGEELERHMLIYKDGSELGIYGGMNVGAETLLQSGLVRAQISTSEVNKAFRTQP